MYASHTLDIAAGVDKVANAMELDTVAGVVSKF
jgi:hypothetical protein